MKNIVSPMATIAAYERYKVTGPNASSTQPPRLNPKTDPIPVIKERTPCPLASCPFGENLAANSTVLVLEHAYVTPCNGSNSNIRAT
mmetsp:Transcript_8131/g.12464  ORF Transcript_8131/g.12464 Transcript_8131/m.12464 type:complete len:87 (-) Transcript_8131:1190-1450(-)